MSGGGTLPKGVALGRAVWLLASDAAASLLRRPAHAMGMMSGILLGAASAFAAVVIADTQQAQIDLRFDLQRSDHAVVLAEVPFSDGFSSEQVAKVALLAPVKEVGEFSTWLDSAPVTRSVAGEPSSGPVLVADPGGLAASGSEVLAGASADLMRILPRARIAWVGEALANELGVAPAGDGVREAQVVVAGHMYSVAGIVANDGGFGYVDHAIVLSRPTALATFGGGGNTIRLVAHVRPGSAAAVAAYTVSTVDPGGRMMLADVTPADGEHLVGNVGADLRRIGAALGAFVGVVGMIAIANTLMMSVHNRLRELGLRSAMGWSRGRIAALVLAEALVAGILAGIVGCALGAGVAAAWCRSQGWLLVADPHLPLLIIPISVLASLVGALIPAWRAASISPLAAMRS